MRIWSLHPKYLDAKGLVALWRETLLAKHVLEGKTKGYKNHPQLNRFKELKNPRTAIHCYLSAIYQEALTRGYNFDKTKFRVNGKPVQITVTQGQVDFEITHLLKKLNLRDKKKYKEFRRQKVYEPHPLFRIVDGDLEDWEIL